MVDIKNSASVRVLVPVFATLTFALLNACANVAGTGTSQEAQSRDARDLAEGGRLYEVSCSGCHGTHARGNGPVGPLLPAKVPDLTLLASRHGGAFPDDEVYRIIDGQSDLTAHGPRHMPVWGYEFFGEDPDDEAAHRAATEKIDRLVRFLQSIQRTG